MPYFYNPIYRLFTFFVPMMFLVIILNFSSNDIAYSEPISNSSINESNATYVKNYSPYADSSKNVVVVGHVIKKSDRIYIQNLTVGMQRHDDITTTGEVLAEKLFSLIMYRNKTAFLTDM